MPDAPPRLRLGLIGCGEVTQINHLPSLDFLPELFEVTALSDVSRRVLDDLGARCGVQARFTDHRELLARADVDAVLVATPDPFHASITLDALAAGKHVLVEKPMCLTLGEADAIIAAQGGSGLTVQVGYMRRYAAAFLEACERVRSLGQVRLARVHAVIGENRLIVEPTSRVLRGDDVPQEFRLEGRRQYLAGLREATGDASPDVQAAYALLLGLNSHDLSVMRELLGMPRGVLYAAQRSKGRSLSAAFDYGDFICHFETGVDDLARFDAHIEVYGDGEVLRVEYDSPYIRHLPTRLRVLGHAAGGGTERRDLHPAWEDNFTAEWRAFHANVTGGHAPKTDPVDARRDLELFAAMVGHMRAAAPVTVGA